MHENQPVVHLPPLLTDDSARRLAEHLRELARASDVSLLTLDARDTIDVSARGLGLLVAVSSIVRSRGGRVTVVNVHERLVPLFEAARLDISAHLLPVVTDCMSAEPPAAARAPRQGGAW